jgi:hypothetical protein
VSFGAFLRRGTLEQCQQLFQLASPQGAPSSQAKKLFATVNALETPEELAATDYEMLWNPTFDPCCTNAFERVGNLIAGINDLGKSPLLSACAIRLSLLFFRHEVEWIKTTISKEMLQSRPGVKRDTIAWNQIIEKCGVTRSEVHALGRRSKRYLEMAEAGGLGTLLILGKKLTT